jgi:hypothetical protein
MIALKLDGVELDLADNTSVSIESASALDATDEQQGGYSYPFDIPNTPRNRAALSYANRLDTAERPTLAGKVLELMVMGISMGKGGGAFVGPQSWRNFKISLSEQPWLYTLANTRICDIELGTCGYDGATGYPGYMAHIAAINADQFSTYKYPVIFNQLFRQPALDIFVGRNGANAVMLADSGFRTGYHPTSPCPTLLHVLDRAFALAGYSLGAYPEYFKKIILPTNGLAMYLESLLGGAPGSYWEMPLNHFASTRTVGELLATLRMMFNVAAVPGAGRIISFIQKGDTLTAPIAKNLTPYLIEQSYEIQYFEEKEDGFTFKYTESDTDNVFKFTLNQRLVYIASNPKAWLMPRNTFGATAWLNYFTYRGRKANADQIQDETLTLNDLWTTTDEYLTYYCNGTAWVNITPNLNGTVADFASLPVASQFGETYFVTDSQTYFVWWPLKYQVGATVTTVNAYIPLCEMPFGELVIGDGSTSYEVAAVATYTADEPYYHNRNGTADAEVSIIRSISIDQLPYVEWGDSSYAPDELFTGWKKWDTNTAKDLRLAFYEGPQEVLHPSRTDMVTVASTDQRGYIGTGSHIASPSLSMRFEGEDGLYIQLHSLWISADHKSAVVTAMFDLGVNDLLELEDGKAVYLYNNKYRLVKATYSATAKGLSLVKLQLKRI